MSNELAEAEEYERLSLMYKALGSGLWDYDIDEDRLLCDKRWYEILGIDESTTPITSIAAFQPYIHPDDVQRATAVDLNEVAFLIENDAKYYNEFRIIRPTGEVRQLRSIACVIEDKRTGHRRAVGCITDLTDTAALEQTLPRWPMCAAPAHSNAESDDQPEQHSTDADRLSARERECLAWVSLGNTAEETGKITGKSRRTIEFHINNAVRKLRASNKVHATVIAIRLGII